MTTDEQGTFPFADGDLQKIPISKLQKLRTIEQPPNQSRAFFAVDVSTRRQFVVKRGIAESDIIAEALGWLLSQKLGILTPNAAVVTSEGGSIGWASSAITNATGWDPDEADLCNQEHVAGIFVLDALIGNPDRHFDNVLVEDLSDERPKSVYSIDLGLAWIGDAQGLFEQGLGIREVAPTGFLRGCSRNQVESYARSYTTKCRELAASPGQLEGLAYKMHTWTGLLDNFRRNMIIEALRARLDKIETLLGAHLDATQGPTP